MKARIAIASFVAAGAALLPAAAAHADATCSTPGGSSCPPSAQVIGTSGFTSPVVQTSGLQTATAPSSGSLPFTGGDVAGLSIVGLALLGGGVVLVRRNRVRSAEVQD